MFAYTITPEQFEAIKSSEAFRSVCCEYASACKFENEGGEFSSDSDAECATDYIVTCEINGILEKQFGYTEYIGADVSILEYSPESRLVVEVVFDNTDKQTFRIELNASEMYTGFVW